MSLGFIGNAPPRIPARIPPVLKKQAESPLQVSQESITHAVARHTPFAWTRSLLLLCIFNILLGGGHLACAIIIKTVTIKFPLTITENRLTEEVIARFTCGYDWLQNKDNVSYCPNKAYATTNISCVGTDVYDIRFLTISNSTNGPLTTAYEIVRTNTDDDGRDAAKTTLFVIAIVTATFHVIYAIAFFNACVMSRRNNLHMINFLCTCGGVWIRWVEYSITAALMSLFIANVSNIFDLNSLIAFSLGTFALMYFGMMIEFLAINGRIESALVLLYIPSMALFALTWLPLARSVWGDISRLTCAYGVFPCTEQTCFGINTPIPLFTFILFLLFAVFPYIEATKLYVLSDACQWSAHILNHTPRLLAPFVFIVLHVIGTLTFMCVVGPFWALRRFLYNIVYFVLPYECLLENVQCLSTPKKISTIVMGEFAFALASATSKYFLFIFFLINFANREW